MQRGEKVCRCKAPDGMRRRTQGSALARPTGWRQASPARVRRRGRPASLYPIWPERHVTSRSGRRDTCFLVGGSGHMAPKLLCLQKLGRTMQAEAKGWAPRLFPG